MRGDLGPVTVGDGRGDDRGDGKLDSGHAAKEFGDLVAFPLQLGGIGEILILAAPAFSEQLADGLDPVGTGTEHLDEVGFRISGVIAEDPRLHEFARKGVGNENDPVLMATDAFPEVTERADLELKLLMISERHGMETGRNSGHGIEDARAN
jgi:hypothetical protein